MRFAVRGLRPATKEQVTLWLDDEVLPWLQQMSARSPRGINHILRREMQRQAKLQQQELIASSGQAAASVSKRRMPKAS